jgi:hypothetical protein|tara:strand:+ start:137 stop:571 length:435 start_codon:yes stop_codon:yes gene_type:complete
MNTDYKIIKLVNGENIVCIVDQSSIDEGYEISFPLQIKTYPVMTKKGPVEQCNLTRWVQPFTEESFFHIKPSDIILIAEASPGIAAYYEQVLRLINKWDDEDMQKFQTDLETGEMQFEIEEELAAEEEMEEAELFDHRLSKAIH